MMPFDSKILENLILRLMKIFIWKAVTDEADSAYSSIKIDLQKRENHLPSESVNLPTTTKTLLSSLQASLTNKFKFKGEYAAIVKDIVEKLQERSPLKYLFVRSLSSFVPKNMIESKNNPSKFEKVVGKLYTAKLVDSKEANNAKLQLQEFISSTANIHKDKFLRVSLADNRLDHFYREYIKGCDKYKDLLKVMVIVFTIPHGQNQIERVFSINNEVTIENLENKSLCDQRLLYDA